MAKTSAKVGQRKKGIEDVVGYALNHRIRVQVLTILAEGVFTPDEIARIIGEPLPRVAHHIAQLAEAGSIELAKTEQVRNATQHWYRCTDAPEFSDEEIEAMTPQQRQVTAGLVLQTVMAEAMAALWAGNLANDPRVMLMSRWFNVDEQGREEIAAEQERSWERMYEIEAEAVGRCSRSGGETRSVMVAELGYMRAREGPTLPAQKANAE